MLRRAYLLKHCHEILIQMDRLSVLVLLSSWGICLCKFNCYSKIHVQFSDLPWLRNTQSFLGVIKNVTFGDSHIVWQLQEGQEAIL